MSAEVRFMLLANLLKRNEFPALTLSAKDVSWRPKNADHDPHSEWSCLFFRFNESLRNASP
jgi:hypothetical protein